MSSNIQHMAHYVHDKENVNVVTVNAHSTQKVTAKRM